MSENVEVVVSIKCLATGEIRKMEMELPIEDGKPDYFIFEDGNYACDCNREIFFTGKADMATARCSNDRYAVEITHDDAVVYSELEEPARG